MRSRQSIAPSIAAAPKPPSNPAPLPPFAVASTVGVTSKPEVTVLPLPSPAAAQPGPTGISNAPAGAASYCSSGACGPAGPTARERHVLIVASDGLWEWVSNAQAVGIASSAATGRRTAGRVERLGEPCSARCMPAG